MSPGLGNFDLWDWAVRAYAGQGVAEACLDLQDDHGQCVPLLLWAVWAGAAAMALADEAAGLARDWQAVIAPLRAARRRLKTEVSAGDEAERLALRVQVKAAELQAEKVLMARLAALRLGTSLEKSTLNQDVEAVLRAVAAAWDGAAPDPARARALIRLARALGKGDFLRYNS